MRLTLLFLCLGMVVAALSEEFNEELDLRPLPDGKAAARFSFSTLLKGATPRDPQTLGSEDECGCSSHVSASDYRGELES